MIQKILTKDIFLAGSDHWNSKFSSNIQCEKKKPLSFFNICKNLQENRQKYVPCIFWAFKSKLQIILEATYIALFFPTLITVFYMYKTIYPYLFLLFSHFVFLFSPSLSYSSRHETYSTISNVLDNFIKNCP